MLSPGYPCLAAPVDTVIATVNGKEMDFIGLGRNLVGLQNFIGFPGLSVPTGRDPILGLPMAIQITTLPGDEGGAFRIGHAYEQSRRRHCGDGDLRSIKVPELCRALLRRSKVLTRQT